MTCVENGNLVLLWKGNIMAFPVSRNSWEHGKWITVTVRLYMGLPQVWFECFRLNCFLMCRTPFSILFINQNDASFERNTYFNSFLLSWLAHWGLKKKQLIMAWEMRKWMVRHRPWNVHLMHAIYLCVISVSFFLCAGSIWLETGTERWGPNWFWTRHIGWLMNLVNWLCKGLP